MSRDDTTREDAEGTMADASERQQVGGDGRKQPAAAEVSPVTVEMGPQSEESPETLSNRQSWTISTGRNKTFSSDHATRGALKLRWR